MLIECKGNFVDDGHANTTFSLGTQHPKCITVENFTLEETLFIQKVQHTFDNDERFHPLYLFKV